MNTKEIHALMDKTLDDVLNALKPVAETGGGAYAALAVLRVAVFQLVRVGVEIGEWDERYQEAWERFVKSVNAEIEKSEVVRA